jgi:lipopolysaccharide/colanic/teichoic acid biosynthesis glycosyltransferase
VVNYLLSSRLSGRSLQPSSAVEVSPRPLKRVFDTLSAGVLLVLLTPVLLGVVVLIRVTSPGRALFRQTRVGQGEKTFTILKFRTMFVDCSDEVHKSYVKSLLSGESVDSSGELFKLADDPRVTRVGGWLRRTSLDELPQLLNVLRGDMALVGPRPVLPFEADMFEGEQRLRFAVRPGLTGLWQVSGRSRISFLDQLALDARYVRDQGFLVDLKILLRTVPTLLLRRTR